jgi:hypothetical protein
MGVTALERRDGALEVAARSRLPELEGSRGNCAVIALGLGSDQALAGLAVATVLH